jgi:putative phosphoesterase
MHDRIAVLSDIHANLTALDAVIQDLDERQVDGVILAGDIINYGPRPNETILRLLQIGAPLLTNIWGNHEYSLFEGSTDRFSTDRGKAALEFTRSLLSRESWDYLGKMGKKGQDVLNLTGKKILVVHGTLDDPYWGKISVDCHDNPDYWDFDFVISGHTHVPHYFEHFSHDDNPVYRNKKKTVFINPGSVGQPRNLNPHAQYAILEVSSGSIESRMVPYNVALEQLAYNDKIDSFYRDRLTNGI